jgi:hypothetical protein
LIRPARLSRFDDQRAAYDLGRRRRIIRVADVVRLADDQHLKAWNLIDQPQRFPARHRSEQHAQLGTLRI